jgi:ribonuclease III
MMALFDLERALGISFSDKSLLQRSLTHRSYLNEHPEFPLEDNERLEFLGDAVLDFVAGEYVYHRFPELPEGPLTSLRSAVVRRETLAHFAHSLNLGRYLLMGRGEEESGGRQRPATLCAAFEALLGAIYLDQGLGQVQAFLKPLIGPLVERILQEDLDKDAKSLLQELAQGRLRRTPRYLTIAETGPDHAKEFTVEVTIGGVPYGEGRGSSKQQAAQAAAKDALDRLEVAEIDFLPTGQEQDPEV